MYRHLPDRTIDEVPQVAISLVDTGLSMRSRVVRVALVMIVVVVSGAQPVRADANEGSPGSARGAQATLSAGRAHVCALLADGSVKCWGDNTFGQLGQGNPNLLGDGPNEMGDNLNPIQLGSGRSATAIAGGSFHSCALLDNGQVKCWGYSGFGQLGQGNPNILGDGPSEMGDNLAPIQLGSGRIATAITASDATSCALLDNGQVKCWGYNGFGQLGQGNTTDLGDGPNEVGDTLAPIQLGSGRSARAITASGYLSCALLDNGQVKCWGQNGFGALGQGNTNVLGDGIGEMGDFLPPVYLGVGRTAVAVTTGAIGSCALLDNASVKCWGWNAYGQLGQGNIADIGDNPGEMAALVSINLGSGALVVPVVVSPAAPTGVAATGGVLSASVSWSAPADNGGAAVTGYRIESSINSGVQWTTAVANTASTAATRNVTGLTAGQAVMFRVSAINGRGVGVPSPPSAAVTPSLTPAVGYLSLDPARLLDTRPGGATVDGLFRTGAKIGAGGEIALQVTGRGGVPGNATAVVLNVTVTDPAASGYATVYPCGTTRPNASNLNYTAGSTIPNNVIVKVGTSGTVCLFSEQTTHLLADINGAFT